MALLALLPASLSHAQEGATAPTKASASTLLDACDDPAAWTVIASDGVTASLAVAPGKDAGAAGKDAGTSKAIRLNYDFTKGSGFVVIRRPTPIDMPSNYRVGFWIRGECPDNNLEFKLVDPSGDNVWWVNRRAFKFPTAWKHIVYRPRHISFAWGPAGPTPMKKLGFIEIGIAASSGGKGFIDLDTLTFEPLPPETAPAEPTWTTDQNKHGEMTGDLGASREVGGVEIAFPADAVATNLDVALSDDATNWTASTTIRGNTARRVFVPTPESEARFIRITSPDLGAVATSGIPTLKTESVRVLGPDVAQTPNAIMSHAASLLPRGHLPRYAYGEQAYWTVVGVADDTEECLINEDGLIETARLGPSIMPIVSLSDAAGAGASANAAQLVTWNDVERSHTLESGYLPIPHVTWTHPKFTLDVSAIPDGEPGESVVYARYRITNTSGSFLGGKLGLAVVPYQVTPPWQALNITGGVAPINTIAMGKRRTAQAVLVDGVPRVVTVTNPDLVSAATYGDGDIAARFADGTLRTSIAARCEVGFASMTLHYPFALPPGATAEFALAIPMHEQSRLAVAPGANTAKSMEAVLSRAKAWWTRELNIASLTLPPSADRLVNTFKSTQAYILINRDGPAIQPGSRCYERSWIRDGSMTSAAMLATGHADKVKQFIEWYAPYQYESGKVPCVVDRRGPDPVPEHDSHGQLIYAILTYYKFTGDTEFLTRMLPRVEKAVDYIEYLRNQRMTPEYRDGPPEQRAKYGLVTESISHEGYSAKPMHSYWDSFFVLKGLKDATTIETILKRADLVKRFQSLSDDYAKCLYDSMRLAMKNKNIDFIPGCVELGDFDATSTTVGLWPCGELGRIPEPALHDTFEKQWKFFTDRRDGKLEWHDYTPYETRIIGSWLYLGRPDRAHEMLDFYFRDQRPQGWNSWGEIVWRDPKTPRFVGDMPHTWVGGDYVNAVRAMFVHERPSDGALVLGAGVLAKWLDEGRAEGAPVRVANFPTLGGNVSYTMSRATGGQAGQGSVVFDIGSLPAQLPETGLVLVNPDARPLTGVIVDGVETKPTDAKSITLHAAAKRVEMRY
ncbi:MAG: coagulation factor 5/8 type domain-containing protein [Planctomycetota bacterium]|nr:coagulation factor 5/8 type domain-containing protein [Planctomycetota bacterium]